MAWDDGGQIGRDLSAAFHEVEVGLHIPPRTKGRPYRIMVRDAGVEPDMVEAVWPIYRFELSLQQSLLTTVQGQARWAKREGHVQSSLPEPEFLNSIDASLLRKVKPSAVDFVFP